MYKDFDPGPKRCSINSQWYNRAQWQSSIQRTGLHPSLDRGAEEAPRGEQGRHGLQEPTGAEAAGQGQDGDPAAPRGPG